MDESGAVQVDFSVHAGSGWPSVCAALEEVRSLTSTHVVQPCRSRVPATSSAALGVQVPTAVVAPIKRELPEQTALVADESSVPAGMTAGSEKYSLPPFETLVTAHRSPEMTASSPSTTTDKRPTPSTTVGVGVPSSVTVGVPSSTVNVGVSFRLPDIHQLFQTTSAQPVTGTGNSLATVNDDAACYAWSQTQLLGAGTSGQSFSQQELVQFFPENIGDQTPSRNLPPPPAYPGPGGLRPYLTYGGVCNTVAEYNSFHSVLSSDRR